MGKIFNMGKMFKKFKPLDLSQSPNRWPHFFLSPRIECEGWITLQENQTKFFLSILPFFLSEKRHWLFLRTFWPTLEQNQTPPVRKKFKRLKRTSTPESVVSYAYMWYKHYKNKLSNLIGHDVDLPITFTPEKLHSVTFLSYLEGLQCWNAM